MIIYSLLQSIYSLLLLHLELNLWQNHITNKCGINNEIKGINEQMITNAVASNQDLF